MCDMGRLFTLIFLCAGSFSLTAGSIAGKVSDGHAVAIPGATVQLQGTTIGAVTDADGKYRIDNVPAGKYVVEVSSIGYIKTSSEVTVPEAGSATLNFSLAEAVAELGEVVVIGKSEATEMREIPFAVGVVDVGPLKVQNLDINQVLNATTGIRIREDGGLGSNFNFSLNGFTGNQVKFFIDGIPMDYFGSSLTLNNIPVNLISNIEVYKGVVPVHLGSDALGGAVNVSTNRSIRNFLNASYSVGSFNTHRASIISQVTAKNGLTVRTNAFFNYSDNSYKVQVEVPDPVSGKVGEPVSVERFHDGYQSQTVQVEAGVENKKFADQLFVGVLASGNYKEIQTGSNMTKVVGEAFTTDRALIPTLKYMKNDVFTDGLSVRVNAVYNLRQAMVVDTVSKIYDWYGNYVYRGIDVRSGEISWDKTEFRFNDESVLTTANISYRIDQNQSVAFNHTYSRYVRVGEDPISYNAVPFSEPNYLTKNISGLSYNLSLLDNKLRTIAFGKLFAMDALTREGDGYSDNQTLREITASSVEGGYGVAATYFLAEGIQIKSSFENTYRLPEAYEMFGDGLLVQSNPYLKPETSQNFNIGILGQKIFAKHEVLFEGGYLFRKPENMIRSAPLAIQSVYENLNAVKADIFEAGAKYKYAERFNIEVNGSYQHIINNQKLTATGGENYLYKDRVPNMPFLFGNAKAGIMFHKIGTESGKLSINWSTLFVEAFYLKWPSQGSKKAKYDIPRQLSHSLVASWSFDDGKYNASVACTNLFDSQLFDNFMLQKPGRAFNLKLSYFLQ